MMRGERHYYLMEITEDFNLLLGLKIDAVKDFAVVCRGCLSNEIIILLTLTSKIATLSGFARQIFCLPLQN